MNKLILQKGQVFLKPCLKQFKRSKYDKDVFVFLLIPHHLYVHIVDIKDFTCCTAKISYNEKLKQQNE